MVQTEALGADALVGGLLGKCAVSMRGCAAHPHPRACVRVSVPVCAVGWMSIRVGVRGNRGCRWVGGRVG